MDLENVGPSEKYAKLNVGGYLYQATFDTLTRGDTMLSSMFSGRMETTKDSEGFHLIDRNGKVRAISCHYMSIAT